MKNVLLVTVDSLRADHVGYHGYDRDTTPNLDRRAESAHVFSNAFSNGCSTRRSFPSILSSTYPLMHGGFERITEDRTLISEALAEQGYETGGFQSNPFLLAEFGYGRGYDHYFGSNAEASSTSKLRQFVKQSFDEDGAAFQLLKSAFDFSERALGYNPGESSVPADVKTDKALEWVSDVSEPAFLWVHYMDVHHPYHPPAEHQLEFRDSVVSKRESVKLRRKMLEAPDEITDGELQTILDIYDGEVRFFDEQMDRLIRETRASLSGETVVAITSDHGDEFNDHHGFAHYDTFYDELLHVPLVIDADGSGRYDELVSLLDLAPTLLDYAGVDVPETFVGDSLVSLVEHGDWNKDAVIAESGTLADEEFRCAYRTDSWKYIRGGDHKRADAKPEEELYDLVEDPEERENVVEAVPGRASEFRDAVLAHKRTLEETDRSVAEVAIDDETQQRLEDLGYK
ncbi:sulfatase [Halorarum halobium]|uniref:sulfatase n=1 Tax=Halorarum halobium TaxID=3075121 RepID=UPI0028AF96DE|nr:sulfatase [Halobaculum sp. XH14]